MGMDGVEEATTQQMEPSAHAAGGGGDLLSGLCDDVLAHILGLAEYARDAVHTGVLSRRWRGLWRRAPALRFASWQQQGGSAEGFIALVDDTLSSPHGRSSDGGLDQLVIEFDVSDRACRNQQLLPPSIAAAERWIGYAVRHGVKSFHFELSLPDDEDEDDYKDDDDDEVHEENSNEETPVLALNELPSSAKLEAMHLKLGDAWVRLPATVVFPSLTDLALESIMVAGDNVLLLLGRLVSSACCPSLQKLRMCHITTRPWQQNLLVEAGVLTELVLDGMFGVRSLELMTPSLRVLCIHSCGNLESLAVSAPTLLEKLTCQQNRLLIINQDFPSVSSLKLDLYSQWRSQDLRVASFDVDIIKCRIPQLGHVRSLKARVGPVMTSSGPHSVGNCVASLLTLFNNLMYLHLDFSYRNKDQQQSPLCVGSARKSKSICDHWESHEISFVHLMETEFRGVSGSDCELRFLRFMLSHATQLRKVVLSFNWEYPLKSRCHDFCHMLLNSGTWTDCHDNYHSYEWRPHQ